MKELRKPDPALRRILPPPKLLSSGDYVRSRFAVPCEQEGLWFNTLTRQLISCGGSQPERVTAEETASDRELTELVRNLFLVPAGKDECAFYQGLFRILHAMVRKKGVTGYTILPTTACNARCVYCFESDFRQVTMTPQVVDKTVAFILKTRRPETVRLNWFGGEPLTAVPVIDAIVGKLREADVPFTGSITTNGSLITRDLARKMAEEWHVKSAQVSMDGDEADYAARKRYLLPEDQYRRVLEGIRLLNERDIRVSVRCNVDESNIAGIGSFLADLAEAVPDRENTDVYLSPLNQARSGGGNPALWRKIAEALPLIRSFGFGGKDTRFILYDLPRRRCMADLGCAVIGPDGSLYACENCCGESLYGNLMTEEADPEAEERFRSVETIRDQCRSCPFLPECTPFASCPVKDAGCQEVQRIRLREKIRAFLEKREPEEELSGEIRSEC